MTSDLNEIPLSNPLSPVNDDTNNIFIILYRGDTFRKCLNSSIKNDIKNQLVAIDSQIKHVINPLKKEFPKSCIKVNLSIFQHNYNNLIIKKFNEQNIDLELNFVDKKSLPNQIETFKHILNNVNIENTFVLILRPDLVFLQNIDYKNIDQDKILFQWNLFTHWGKICRVPDQIHFIGGNVFNKFKKLILNNKPDNKYPNSLHNLFCFLIENNWNLKNISYLNYIKNPNPNQNDCKIKGNPNNSLGNPIFNYTRYLINT